MLLVVLLLSNFALQRQLVSPLPAKLESLCPATITRDGITGTMKFPAPELNCGPYCVASFPNEGYNCNPPTVADITWCPWKVPTGDDLGTMFCIGVE